MCDDQVVCWPWGGFDGTPVADVTIRWHLDLSPTLESACDKIVELESFTIAYLNIKNIVPDKAKGVQKANHTRNLCAFLDES